ncbi:MAG: hypothetical protein NTV94_03365 [Planctomycetota bacterium]|nr:hypothetical protein [Planctomycetota bacterium]
MDRILSVLLVGEHRAGDGEKTGANGRDQRVERGLFASPQSGQKLVVGETALGSRITGGG